MKRWRKDTHRRFFLGILLLAILIQSFLFAIKNIGIRKDSKTIPHLRSFTRKYASSDNPGTLNVHVVPHTHDDVGWLKTIEQYYYGWNQTIQVASVQTILDSVVQALLENPNRTFIYVEMKFFQRWWEEQSNATKHEVKRLVQDTQQLSFVNGGWCMHDEATTHYMGMIDQTSLGHDFLKETFGYVPTVGWQLDPFGHSATQASLMTYQMGFDALYFGRIDYQDRELRRATSECEGLWNINPNKGGDKSVFWGLTGSYNGQYGPPNGVCFDPNCDQEDYTPLIEMNATSQLEFVKNFFLSVKQQSDQTQGNHIMLTMGEDFRYQKALVNFANLDLLLETIEQVSKDGSIDIPSMFGPEYDAINVFYSSPEYYTRCKHDETLRSRKTQKNGTVSQHEHVVKWSVKRDDFFPYSDCPHCFWTGYFSSRPSLKRFERVGSSFLLAVRQIESLFLPNTNQSIKELSSNLRVLADNDKFRDNEKLVCGHHTMHQLEDAIGVLQHHDGVSGTSKQHVAYDYAKRLQDGMNAVLPCTIQTLKDALLGNNHHFLDNMEYCQLLNETKCDVSVNATRKTDEEPLNLYIFVYNSLASERSTVIDLPVGSDGTYIIETLGDDERSSSSRMIVQAQHASFPSQSQENKCWVVSFLAKSLPAIGGRVFRIRKQTNNIRHQNEPETKTQTISNGYFSLRVDSQTGDIRRIGSKGVESLSTWGYYTSFDSKTIGDATNEEKAQNSGAYVFRPSTPTQELIKVPTKNSSVVKTPLGTEIQTEYQEPWIRTVTKLRTGIPYLEIEYQIGPIPMDDGIGKEVVTRYNTMVDNDGVFYTDSNGRNFLRRESNYRPTWNLTVFEPIAGNYYPVNTAIYVDEASSMNSSSNGQRKTPAAFAVVTDRSQGGSSIVDGTVELMVHRRILADDDRGVDEPLNETVSGIDACPPFGNATRFGEGLVIRGKHRILMENDNHDCNPNDYDKATCGGIGGARLARSQMDESFAESLVFVGTARSSQEIPFRVTSFSGMKAPFPSNVMLITKKIIYGTKTYLVRLGHQYGPGEDPDFSHPVDVDLSHLFPGQDILEFQETTLSGNRAIEEWKTTRFHWTESAKDTKQFSSSTERGTSVTLEALDIRTFLVTIRD